MFGSQLYNDELPHSSENLPENKIMAINKLRLPRKLLEKWVEEPFFDTAVVGCFVRLGVGAFDLCSLLVQWASCLQVKHLVCVVNPNTRFAKLLAWGNINIPMHWGNSRPKKRSCFASVVIHASGAWMLSLIIGPGTAWNLGSLCLTSPFPTVGSHPMS